MNVILEIVMIGIGATIIMDLWAIIQKFLFNIPSLNYMYVGRWLGHFLKGEFFHDTILIAKPIKGETVIGWLTHYTIGIIFSFILIAIVGSDWLVKPTFLPAMMIGIISVIAPFFIMQPGFGFGLAGSKTPQPKVTRIRSLVAHLSYGIGLYFSAQLLLIINNSLSS